MNDLTIQGAAALPAHLAQFGGQLANDDLSAGVSAGYPVISYRGKVWALSQGKERTVITNDRGEPRYSLDIVIVKANPNISKVWYKDGYEEGSDAKPDCYSNDGITPALDAPIRGGGHGVTQCAACPWNQFGSKITENGAKGKACADARRLAVVPEGDLENAMLLRVPAASLKELRSYSETLTKRGIPYQAVVTNVSFDMEAAYPKLVFKPVRFLDANEAPVIIDMKDRQIIDDITLRDNPQATAQQVAHTSAVDALGAMPAHLQAATPQAPVQTTAKTVTEAEVAAAMQPATTPAASPNPAAQSAAGAATTTFGKPVQSAPPAQAQAPAAPSQAPVDDQVTVLAENAMSGLDAALATLDG